MQPLQYDLRCPAVKDNSITHAAGAPSNLDAAITTRDFSNSDSWRCKSEAFVRDFPESLKVEDVKTKLSCETPFNKWK